MRRKRKRNRRNEGKTQESCNSCAKRAGAPEHLAHLAHAKPAALKTASHRLGHVAFHPGVLGCSLGGFMFSFSASPRDYR